MPTTQLLEDLLQQYEALRQKLIDAVGSSADKPDIEALKRQLETVASQIRKIDVNRKL